jgi:hypothetical protein
MKIIFLDIDGVLNSWQNGYYFGNRINKLNEGTGKCEDELCPICVSNLNILMESCEDVDIVISSTWRQTFDIETLKNIFRRANFLYPEKIIDYTDTDKKFSQEFGSARAEQIKRWLEKNDSVDRYAVLDDCYLPIDNFFHVDQRIGLDWHTANKVRSHFGGKQFGTCLI